VDGVTIAVCLAIIGSNAGLWYKVGKLEQQVKLLNSSLDTKK